MWCMAFRRTLLARLSPQRPMQLSLSQNNAERRQWGGIFRGEGACACYLFGALLLSLLAPLSTSSRRRSNLNASCPSCIPFPFHQPCTVLALSPPPPLRDCIPFHQTMHTTLPSCQSILLPPTTLHTITDYTATHVCAQRSAAHDTSWLVSNTRRLRSAGASHSDGALG